MGQPEKAGWTGALKSALAALAVAVAGLAAVAQAHSVNVERLKSDRRANHTLLAASLTAGISRELNGIVATTSGLRSYLAVRHDSLDADELQRILEQMYASTRLVRNFGIAVGYEVRYVYPLAGNEKAIGIRYPELPEQWAGIRPVVDSGQPLLAGPVTLVQGGEALIYRQPILVDGAYWGLLSTVIEFDALMASASSAMRRQDVRFAVRGLDARGASGSIIFGEPAVFEDPHAVTMDMDVPGGSWQVVVASSGRLDLRTPRLLLGFGTLLVMVLTVSTFLILRQRGQLKRLALYDALTDLPNRHLLEDRFNLLAAMADRNPTHRFAVMFVDLDHFKRVNDRHGHRAGDALLRAIARRLRRSLRKSDTIGRWGGDELVVVSGMIQPEGVSELVERLRQAIQQPVSFEGHELSVGASIGVALYRDDGTTLAMLIREADMRMYGDKGERDAAS